MESTLDKNLEKNLTALKKARKKTKSNLSNNLKKLMKLANISESELSRRTKIKQPIIHRLLSGENTNPKLLTIKPIADYFMLTVSQLIGENEIHAAWDGFTSKEHAGWCQVPLINWDEINKRNVQKRSKYIVTECAVSKDAFALLMLDQSMEPLFPEKSIIIIEPLLEPKSGNYIILKTSKNEPIVRNYLIISGNKFFSPLNPKFGTIIQFSKQDEILGTVIRTIYDHIAI